MKVYALKQEVSWFGTNELACWKLALIFKHFWDGLHVMVDYRIRAPENGLFRAWRPCLRHRLFQQLRCILRCRYPVLDLATTSLSLVPSSHITVCSRLAVNVWYHGKADYSLLRVFFSFWLSHTLMNSGLFAVIFSKVYSTYPDLSRQLFISAVL